MKPIKQKPKKTNKPTKPEEKKCHCCDWKSPDHLQQDGYCNHCPKHKISSNPLPQSEPRSGKGWEKDFDKKFSSYDEDGVSTLGELNSCWCGKEIKAFIAQQIKQAFEEGKQEGVNWNRPEILAARIKLAQLEILGEIENIFNEDGFMDRVSQWHKEGQSVSEFHENHYQSNLRLFSRIKDMIKQKVEEEKV